MSMDIIEQVGEEFDLAALQYYKTYPHNFPEDILKEIIGVKLDINRFAEILNILKTWSNFDKLNLNTVFNIKELNENSSLGAYNRSIIDYLMSSGIKISPDHFVLINAATRYIYQKHLMTDLKFEKKSSGVVTIFKNNFNKLLLDNPLFPGFLAELESQMFFQNEDKIVVKGLETTNQKDIFRI